MKKLTASEAHKIEAGDAYLMCTRCGYKTRIQSDIVESLIVFPVMGASGMGWHFLLKHKGGGYAVTVWD